MFDIQDEGDGSGEGAKQKRLSLASGLAARWKFAVAWFYFQANRIWISSQIVARKYRPIAVVALLLLLCAANVFGIPRVQILIGVTFYDKDAFAGLKAFCLAIGAALLGATAIASSFILFAMQVNVTRMPNGLFRRLSTDRRLLSVFAMSFTISSVVAAASLVPRPEWGAIMIVGTFECGTAILGLYLYAYGRALRLINPLEQLGILVQDAARDLKKWGRRADRAYAFLPEPEQRRRPMQGEVVSDIRRTQFFRANDGWDRVARQAINYATSYARYFAEQGDHEVSSSALNALLRINAGYIEAKGTTFFNNILLIENPLVTDGIINTTLEALRQTMQIALARGDERQATQTLEAMEAAARLYLQISYPGVGGGKTHAHLAVGYLSSAVESVVPHKMVDVLMRGMQLLGSSANAMIAAGAITDSTLAIDKIGVLGAVGIVGEPFRPVLLTAIDQLSDVTFLLLRVRGQQLNFTFDSTLDSVVLLAKLLLATPDVPLSSIHSSNLGPYFSSTSQTALRFKLTQLVNALNDERAVGALPRDIIQNLATWSDDLPKELKELLLLAVQNRSAFTFDLLAWIAGVVEILIAASHAPAAERVQDELQRTALHIARVLSWVPTDRDTAAFVEARGMTNNLFAMMEDAQKRDSVSLFEATRKMLLHWAVTAGAHRTGWRILEKGLCALCANALEDPHRRAWIIANLTVALAGEEPPDAETRGLAARSIRHTASEYRKPDFIIDRIERRLASAPYQAKRDFLHEVADVLHPPGPEEGGAGPVIGGDDDDYETA